jgi:hypothetical protein
MSDHKCTAIAFPQLLLLLCCLFLSVLIVPFSGISLFSGLSEWNAFIAQSYSDEKWCATNIMFLLRTIRLITAHDYCL